MAKRETYATARKRLLTDLAALGWTVKPNLKVPQAIHPDGKYTLFFHAQAVYKDYYSMWLDIRDFTTAQFVEECNS